MFTKRKNALFSDSTRITPESESHQMDVFHCHAVFSVNHVVCFWEREICVMSEELGGCVRSVVHLRINPFPSHLQVTIL